ncbi:uncharacterized protein LOC112602358 [Melanaphis sacchari]|uniref:uncharacterized protein LOC112602358 n=1 Tax=Melanaphis sacchari TaxID=742174 RepID=UPI000DC13D15|nr:uncharacterized protein LOC112602358 [Melanaphis sacchari]
MVLTLKRNDKQFRNKWLALINYGKNDLGVTGYLKCDIVMFYERHMINNFIVSKSLGSTIEDIKFNKNDLFIPNGFRIATTHLAKYSIKLHRGEVIRFLHDEGPKWLSIDFGEAPETSILLNLNGTELNWNKHYSIINVYPPLCPIIRFKFILCGKIMASKMISIHDFIGNDGLPCFGPAFLHFTTLESQYFGRILLSVETELVPSEVESFERLQIDDIDSILEEDLMYIPIIIIGVILCVNHVHKNLINSKNMTITMDYSEYNLATESENKRELINSKTSEYKVVRLENDFYKLLIEEDRKPCLFLVTNLPSIEYYAMFSMNLLSKTISSMSYNGPPNIFLNLHDGKQIVLGCQIQTRNFLYSKISECKGKFCKRIRPWFLSTKIKENVFDGIMETIFWIGPYEDFKVGLRQIPGLLYNNCSDQPCSQYNYKLYEKTFLQLRAHISQVALTEKCYKKYSQLNLMTRIIFNGHSITTKVRIFC